MKTGNGKIANLPSHIRDELNYRLADGEQGTELVDWLNAKPEVIKVIRERFDGTPISEQNLSEWRKRGYQKWLAFHNFVDESNELGDNAEVIATTGIDCEKLLLTLTAAYADMIQNWIITPCEGMTYKLAVYKKLTDGVIALQRAELQKVRLEIARERLELLREKRCHKSPEAIGRPARSASCSDAGGGAGGGPGKSRATGPSASSPKSAPTSDQNNSECRSRDGGIELRHSPEPADPSFQSPSLSEAFEPPHSAVAPSALPLSTSPKPSQPDQPTHPTAAQASEKSDPRHSSFELRHSSTPAPKPNSSAHPVIRRPNDPPNTLYGIPIIRNLGVRPAPSMAPGWATQTPKPSAPKVVPSRPIPHR